jgi:large subunit ribosomal protein L13
MSTNVLSNKEIKRAWHQIDAKDQILGRLASEVATILSGKKKPQFVPYMDNGDFVVVTNAAKVSISGKKGEQKKYYRHSGFPGGLKTETFNHLVSRRPEEVIRHAVKGMLPKNKLGRRMIKKLHVFAGPQHIFAKQLGQSVKSETPAQETAE